MKLATKGELETSGAVGMYQMDRDKLSRRLRSFVQRSSFVFIFRSLLSAAEVVPHIVEGFRRVRGGQISPTKVSINIRFDADVIASLRESGRGWQTRVNDILRKAIIG